MIADAINEDYSKSDKSNNDADEVFDISTPGGVSKLNRFLGQ